MNGHELGKRKCAMFINTHLYFIYYYSMQHFSMNVCSKGNIFCLRFPCYISEIVQLLMLYTAFYYISSFRVPKVSWRTFVNFYDCGCGLSTIFRNIGFRTMVSKVTAVIATTAFLPITENYSTVINLLVQFTWWFRLMHQSYLLQLAVNFPPFLRHCISDLFSHNKISFTFIIQYINMLSSIHILLFNFRQIVHCIKYSKHSFCICTSAAMSEDIYLWLLLRLPCL